MGIALAVIAYSVTTIVVMFQGVWWFPMCLGAVVVYVALDR